MFIFSKQPKKEPKDLKEVLNQFKDLQKNFKEIKSELDSLKKSSSLHIQKIGIIRFNPFSEVGGDQSFSLALLDETDFGVVITSLYTREENRVYGKPIKKGLSEYSLSEEEKQAIEEAKTNGRK